MYKLFFIQQKRETSCKNNRREINNQALYLDITHDICTQQSQGHILEIRSAHIGIDRSSSDDSVQRQRQVMV